jgi:uncharacterized membrane protein SpoIIM required for sporulation
MLLNEFVESKKEIWSELEELVSKVQERSLKSLSSDELDRLGYLYRRVTSDLAVARRDFPGDKVVQYLNDLSAQASMIIYSGEPIKRGRIAEFFLETFPSTFRSYRWFIAVAFAIFILGFTWSYVTTLIYPEFGERVLPDQLVKTIKSQKIWTEIPKYQRSLASSLIMTNNIRVSFFAFALGITFMLGTVYVLLANGIMIGAVGGLCQVHGLSLPLWSFVSPHGYIELSVVFMAGGAGLAIGYSILNPSYMTRGRSLVEAAGRSVRLIGGCVPLLMAAGMIEGFLSPSGLNPWVKIIIGPITGSALYWYLLRCGAKS